MTAGRRFAGALIVLLAGCTTGQANTTPPVSSGGGGAANAVLQMSVGTINFGGLVSGLNVLETFRGANGYTALPITTATLHGPAAFRAPKGSMDPGSGAHGSIPIGNASNQFVVGSGISPPETVLAAADGWGIGPPSCSCGGINFYPFQPQFADVTLSVSLFPGGPEPFYGGPPGYPPTNLAASALSQLVSIPSGWAEGFYLVSLPNPPPTGRYALGVSYLQNGIPRTKSTAATLQSARLLPSILGQPEAKSDGRGGMIASVKFVRGIKQMVLNVIDANVPPSSPPSGGKSCPNGLGFATLVFNASGTKRIPDNLGNYGKGGARTFCKGDILSVQLLGFDYDDVDLGPPGNVQQRPVLPAQADVTYSTTVVFE